MITCEGSREIRAAVLALKAAPREIARRIRTDQRTVMNPVWRAAVAENITWNMERLTLNTGVRIAAGNPPTLVAAASRRRLSGGLVPDTQWPGYEYGADPNAYSRYTRRNRTSGGTHKVARRTMRHLRPRKRAGYVLGPAVAETAPRLAALFTQTVVRGYMDALDPKGTT